MIARGERASEPRPRYPHDPVRSASEHLPVHPSAREPALVAAIGALCATAVVALAPPAQDLAAHVYRASLVRHGVLLWDNYWYAGDYPLATYSLLTPALTALVGVAALMIACTAIAGGLFALVAQREWGAEATWPGRAFGVAAALPLLPGLDAYALGVPLALASIAFVQRRRVAWCLVFATLTLAASPLAFAVLVGVSCSVALAGRCRRATVVRVGFGLVGLGLVEFVLARVIFPTPGVYPFLSANLIAIEAISALGVVLAYKRTSTRPIAWLLGGWGVLSLASFLVPNPIGDNVGRLRYAAFPLILLVAIRHERRRLASIVAIGALAYACVPDLVQVGTQADAQSARSAYWSGAVGYLHRHLAPGARVEVVATSARWEAYYLPASGIPLARGWFRQTDLASNSLLYRRTLAGPVYRRWLDRMAVAYVLLPPGPLDDHGASTEARLLRSRSSGLRLVWRAAGFSIFAVPSATSLISGPSGAEVTTFTHARITGSARRGGINVLRVRYTPYWSATGSAVCVLSGADGMSRVRFRGPGVFALRVLANPLSLAARIDDPDC